MVSEAERYNTFILTIQQVRENINAGIFGKKTRVSGGKAIGFYASIVFELRRADIFGDKNREVGYLLEITGEKTRTRYERRKAYIAVDHGGLDREGGFDGVKSDLIFLYDLVNESTKFDTTKASALKWVDVWDSGKAGEPAEAITNEQYKEFSTKYELDELVRAEYGTRAVGNIKKFISNNPKVREDFINEYGVMSLDILCEYIEKNNLEDELRYRVMDKFYTLEENVRPNVERKSRRL